MFVNINTTTIFLLLFIKLESIHAYQGGKEQL